MSREVVWSRRAVLMLSALWAMGSTATRLAARAERGDALSEPLDRLAERYVRLVLALGQHDSDYVDAYYGPEDWRVQAREERIPLSELVARGKVLLDALAAGPDGAAEPGDTKLRRTYLVKQARALVARAEQAAGRRYTFDEESRLLYDSVAPTHDRAHFEVLAARLDKQLPGKGPTVERYRRFRDEFVIPPERLSRVFTLAIDAARERTLGHLERFGVPSSESFRVEYVSDKPWSGYNWYMGDYRSVIQVNTDLPIHIDRALDLACHEGYPGHHVYNVLLEKVLTRGRGWVEFSVYPLFSPQSLIAEGTANYGIEVAFPREERIDFERDTLYPAAGLNGERAREFEVVQALVHDVSYAGNEAARGYLDGRLSKAAAAEWLTELALMTPAAAEKRVAFIDRYRSYVINYNWGKDLVAAYVGRPAHRAAQWERFVDLLASPRLPSSLTDEAPQPLEEQS